ncbi:MAG: hypothetical protein ACLRFR_01175, partial [Clostridia bacterium]
PSLTAQEQLLAGTLELDPETDPVICTTESGIEIKFSQATISNATSTTIDHAGQTTAPSSLSGYAYLKMGNYNWIIIGYNTSSTIVNVTYTGALNILWSDYLANPSKFAGNSFAQVLIDEESDAGLAINSASSNGKIYTTALNFALDCSLAVNPVNQGLTELSSGEVLVLSQYCIGSNIYFPSGTYYSSSTALGTVRNLYYPSTNKNDAGFSASESALIKPKTLTTNGSTTLTEYLFLLGYGSSPESFTVNTYLPNNSQRIIGVRWWLRSHRFGSGDKYRTYTVNDSGSIGSGTTGPWGIRPAMVIKL